MSYITCKDLAVGYDGRAVASGGSNNYCALAGTKTG